MVDGTNIGPIVGAGAAFAVLGLIIVLYKPKDRSQGRLWLGIIVVFIGVIVLASAILGWNGVLVALAIFCEVVKNVFTFIADIAGTIASYLRQQAGR